MAQVLIVEDDEEISDLLASGLTTAGHQVRQAATGHDALALADTAPPDLVLLDLGLPDVDGVAVCRSLRSRHADAVIVIVTARRDEIDVIAGLDAGADDYLRKPFSLAELLARLRAHLRRADPGADAPEQITIGDLQIDLSGRRCYVADSEVTLRRKEFDLLVRLAREPGRALSRETLMSDVWDENWFGPTKTLDVTMATLRRRLEAAAGDGVTLPAVTTVRGHGYRLDLP
jgi:DNA-binding response OmpR family regulator